MVISDSQLYKSRHTVDHTGTDVVNIGQLYDVITGTMRGCFMFEQPIKPDERQMGDIEYSKRMNEINNTANVKILQDFDAEIIGNKLSVKHEGTYHTTENMVVERTRYTKILQCHSIPHNLSLHKDLPQSGFTHVVSHVYLGVVIEITYTYKKELFTSSNKTSVKGKADQIKKLPGLKIAVDTSGDIDNALERKGISRKIVTNCGIDHIISRESSIEEAIKKIPETTALKCIKYTLVPVDEVRPRVQISDVDERLMSSKRTRDLHDKFQIVYKKMSKINEAVTLHNIRTCDRITLHVADLKDMYKKVRSDVAHLVATIRRSKSFLSMPNSPGNMAEKFHAKSSLEYDTLVTSLDFCYDTFLCPINIHNKNAEEMLPNKSRLLLKLLFDRIARSDIRCIHDPNVKHSVKEDLVHRKWSWMNMGGTNFQYYCNYDTVGSEQVYNVFYEATCVYIDTYSASRMQNVLLKYANGNKGIPWDEGSIIRSHSEKMLERMRVGFRSSNLII